MLKLLDKTLIEFRSVFSHEAAFNWFVIIILGFITRIDHVGATSFIRWLYLEPKHYDALLLSFRATSWRFEELFAKWTAMAVTFFRSSHHPPKNLGFHQVLERINTRDMRKQHEQFDMISARCILIEFFTNYFFLDKIFIYI